MNKPVDVSIKRLAWPKRRETVNGFHSKHEIEAKIKDLTAGLKAFRLGTENMASISFYPEDVVFFKAKRFTWCFDRSYPPNGRLICYVGHGTRLTLRPEANQNDRFDDGPDCGIGDRHCNLFERLIHFPDIVDMDFIYDEDYWDRRKGKEPYSLVETDKFINIYVPYSYDERYSKLNNNFQKAWIDKQGCLNIMWTKIRA